MIGQKYCPFCQAPALRACAHLALAVEARDFVRELADFLVQPDHRVDEFDHVLLFDIIVQLKGCAAKLVRSQGELSTSFPRSAH